MRDLPSSYFSLGLAARVISALLLIGCGSEPTVTTRPTDPASRMFHASGDVLQNAVVTFPVSDPPAVKVTDDSDRPVAGIKVEFAVERGAGILSGESAITNAQGLARAGSWTLGEISGPNTVTATSPGLPTVTFRASAAPGAIAKLKVLGGGQVTEVGTTPSVPISIFVGDKFDNPIPNARVAAFVAEGGGTLPLSFYLTDSTGRAALSSWQVGTVAGVNVLHLFVDSLTINVAATGIPARVSKIVFLPAASVVARASRASIAPGARVVDRFDNPVSGVPVTFAITPASAALTNLSAISDSAGLVHAGKARAPDHATAVTVTASTPGVAAASLTFSTETVNDAADFVARDSGMCARKRSGIVFCWGRNADGAIGDLSRTDRLVPVGVESDVRFNSLTSSQRATCGLDDEGAAFCWGHNTFEQLAVDGRFVLAPARVKTSLRFSSLAATTTGALCGLTRTAEVHCWLGYPPSPVIQLVPSQIPLESLWGGGSQHRCGLDGNAAAWCWGSNIAFNEAGGQLGDGTGVTRTVPTKVLGDLRFSSMALGDAHTCGLTLSGIAWCWGRNDDGQLGDSTFATRLAPVRVATTLRFVHLAAGGGNTCGITATHQTYCWGRMQVDGFPIQQRQASPLPFAPSYRLTRMALSGSHGCGQNTSGIVLCWGNNFYGELGDGTTVGRLEPAPVIP